MNPVAEMSSPHLPDATCDSHSESHSKLPELTETRRPWVSDPDGMVELGRNWSGRLWRVRRGVPSISWVSAPSWSRYLISGWCPMTVQSNDSRHHEAASRYAFQRFLVGLQPARAPEGASAVTSWNLANEPPLRFCNNRRSGILLSFPPILRNDDYDNEPNGDSEFLARAHHTIFYRATAFADSNT